MIPISTLYASPEKTCSDGFWAFHPKRETRPSLPFRLTRPLIPKLLLLDELELRLARIALSVNLSADHEERLDIAVARAV